MNKKILKQIVAGLAIAIAMLGVAYAATVETPDTASNTVQVGGLPTYIPVYFSPAAAGDIDLPSGFWADYVEINAADGIKCIWAYGMTAGYAQKTAADGTTHSVETSNGITVTNGNVAFGTACQDTDGQMTGFILRYSR